MTRVRQACILVGGRGTRLGDLTLELPKPLLPIHGDRSFLEFLIQEVARQGFDDVLLLAGYHGELVADRFHGRRQGSAAVRVVVEDSPLGTGGALIQARHLLSERFLLLNGDSWIDENLRGFVADIDDRNTAAGIILRKISNAERYGRVELVGDRVTRFEEKKSGSARPALINAGVYYLQQDVLDLIHGTPCSLETEILPQLARAGKLIGRVSDGYFIDIGLPESLAQARQELWAHRRRRAVFLDRDGVLNADTGYVHLPAQVEWTEGAPAAVRLLNDSGYYVIVVTNQAGIAHGYYGEKVVFDLHDWMQDELAKYGGYIDGFYFCPYHPDGKLEEYRRVHDDRKPSPGMILRAIRDFELDTHGSFLVGDKKSDLDAAEKAGIPGFLFTGGNLAEFISGCKTAMGTKASNLNGNRAGRPDDLR